MPTSPQPEPATTAAAPVAAAVAPDAVLAGAPTPAPTLGEVLAAAERLWPAGHAEPWDRVGLAVGDPGHTVRRILLAVDPLPAAVDEAVETGADLLLTHHPLLLRGAHTLATTTGKGALVTRLIRAGVAQFAAHTNADRAVRGVSRALAEALGLVDVVPLEDAGDGRGLGAVGALPAAERFEDFVARAAAALPPTAVRAAGDPDRPVRRVAVCGGSGDSFFGQAVASGADVYLTADLRHHPATDLLADRAAAGAPIALVDVSHFASEWPWLPWAAADLVAELARAGRRVEAAVSTRDTDAWNLRLAPPAL